MNALDIRNDNFASLRDRLEDSRRDVLCSLAAHGPCTTRQLAQLSQRDILSVRPRITELKEVGLVVLAGRESGEGIYRVAAQPEWEAWHAAQLEEQTSGQLQLV